MDPNKAFKDTRHRLIEVYDNGKVYYKIRCSVCNYERFVASVSWNADTRIPQCAKGCTKPNFKRI